MNASYREFEEIGHTGGKVIFDVKTDQNGQRAFPVTWQVSPATISRLTA
jgi:hypothetical protein